MLRDLSTVLFGALLFAASIVGVYLIVLLLVEGYVARDLEDRFGLAGTPEVDLEPAPPLGLLTGEFEGGRVTLVDPELTGGLRPEVVAVELAPFEVDVLGSISGGRLVGEGPMSGLLSVELSEEEVARIASGASVALVTDVELEDGYVAVGSEVNLSGARVPVGVEGGLSLRGGRLVFEPRGLSALGVSVPDKLAEGLVGGASFSYPVDELLPFEGTLSDVEAREDRLVLSGEAPISLG